MSCERCLSYAAEVELLRGRLLMVRDALYGCVSLPAPRPPRQKRAYTSELGKLISGAAEAKGLKLPAVSRKVGYGDDYLGRICRGDLPLSKRAALLFGPELGLDLLPYVELQAPPAAQQPPDPQLPLQPPTEAVQPHDTTTTLASPVGMVPLQPPSEAAQPHGTTTTLASPVGMEGAA